MTPDFEISASAFTPATVTPGKPASLTISTTAIGGFTDSIAISCSVQPSVAMAPTCSVNPTSVTGNSSSNLTVLTIGPGAGISWPPASPFLYAIWLPVVGLLASNATPSRKDGTTYVRLLVLSLLLAASIFQVSCGGGNFSNTDHKNGGTPAGTYTIVITAVSGSLQHSTNAMLIVQ
jgi:hypothetical protein